MLREQPDGRHPLEPAPGDRLIDRRQRAMPGIDEQTVPRGRSAR
jgi:hypothetical protein